jgi:ABC-type enterobactin transport system permease subunit
MTDDLPPERKKVDLTTLPVAAQYAIALGTVAVVVAIVLLVGDGAESDGPDVPVGGLIAGVVAAVAVYALMAWRRQHR